MVVLKVVKVVIKNYKNQLKKLNIKENTKLESLKRKLIILKDLEMNVTDKDQKYFYF
jgi:hypothetical protein